MNKIERLHSIFNCKVCNQVLEDPIILPCGESICSRDVDHQVDLNILSKQLECQFCNCIHTVPDQGFPSDKRARRMLKMHLDELLFGSVFDNCKNVLGDLNLKTNELHTLETDPDYFIFEYFSKITNQVDTVREELKMKIDMHYYDLITEIKKIEGNCKLKAGEMNKSSDEFNASKKVLNELNKKFDLAKLDDRNLTTIAREANDLKLKIVDKIKECEWMLLGGMTYEFQPIKIDMEEVFGVFKVNERQKCRSYSELINSGNHAYERGFYNEAISFHDKAIELESTFSDAYFYKGNALHSLHKFEEAILSYDKAIEYDCTDYEAFTNKGISLNSSGKHDEALAQFRRALELNPEYTTAVFSIANTLNSIGKFTESLVFYDRVIAKEPENSLSYFNKGVALHKLNRLVEEIACYDATISINPKYTDAYYYKASVLCGMKRYEEAITCLDKNIELKPDCAEAYNCKGQALNCIGEHSQALEMFNKAILLDPGQTEFYRNKRLTLTTLGRNSEALSCYNLAAC